MATKTLKLKKPIFDLSPPPLPVAPKKKRAAKLNKVLSTLTAKTADGLTLPLMTALAGIDPDKIPLNEIELVISRKGSVFVADQMTAVLEVQHSTTAPDPAYDAEKVAFDKATAEYEPSLEAYERENKKHKVRLDLWDKAVDLQGLIVKSKRTVAENNKVKTLRTSMTKLLKALELNYKPDDIEPIPTPKTKPVLY